jgi:VanZ family protein
LPNAIATWANEYPAFRNFPAFGVVAMSLYFCVFSWLQQVLPKRLLALALFCSIMVSLFGVLLECLQIWLPTRFFDPYDIAWSIAGAFAGSILAFSVSICLINRK